jgi:hypothetical protein
VLVEKWLDESTDELKILNVAGPRESEAPGLYALTRALLEKAFRARPPYRKSKSGYGTPRIG